MLTSILRLFGLSKPTVVLGPEGLAALDEFVHEVDPKFFLVSDYQDILTPGIDNLVNHADILAQSLREPVELSLRQFSLDYRLGIFFSSPLSLLQTIQTSRVITEYFAEPQSGDTVYALLVMRNTEKARFGYCEENGMTRSDVMQRVISFDQHRLALVANDEAGLRQSMRQRAIHLLCRAAAARLLAQDSQRVQLQTSATELGIKLRIAEQSHNSNAVGMKAKLTEMQATLQKLDTCTHLETRLQCAADYLNQPDRLLRITSSAICLDRMGVVQDSRQVDVKKRVDFEEATFLNSDDSEERCVVLPVTINRTAIRSLEEAVTGGY